VTWGWGEVEIFLLFFGGGGGGEEGD